MNFNECSSLKCLEDKNLWSHMHYSVTDLKIGTPAVKCSISLQTNGTLYCLGKSLCSLQYTLTCFVELRKEEERVGFAVN